MNEDIIEFFNKFFNVDVADVKVYYTELNGRLACFDYVHHYIAIDSSLKPINREFRIVHELTHYCIDKLHLDVDDEERVCKVYECVYLMYLTNTTAVKKALPYADVYDDAFNIINK